MNQRGGNYGANAGNYNQNGFNPQQQNAGMMNQMYGGMTPALMAQWYQRMQAYYAAMGRPMMPGMQMGGMPGMGMPGVQGMPMGMGQQMMGGMGQQPGMGGYGDGMPMQQGYGSPPEMATSLFEPSFGKARLGSTGSDGSSARSLRARLRLELVEPGSNGGHPKLGSSRLEARPSRAKLGSARELSDVTHKV
jgi:hypothetical protein